LAGKAEETPKKCRDIIRTTRQLTNDRQFETFGVDPREEIMALERVLLQTIHFDLQVDHPYASIIQYAKTLKGDKSKLQKMVQMSWTFINDRHGAIQIMRDIMGGRGRGSTICHTNFFATLNTVYNGFWK